MKTNYLTLLGENTPSSEGLCTHKLLHHNKVTAQGKQTITSHNCFLVQKKKRLHA